MFKQGAFMSLFACSRLGPEHITHMTFGISRTRSVSDLRNILQARVRWQNVDETSETSHSLFTHWRTEASSVWSMVDQSRLVFSFKFITGGTNFTPLTHVTEYKCLFDHVYHWSLTRDMPLYNIFETITITDICTFIKLFSQHLSIYEQLTDSLFNTVAPVL